MKRLSNFQERYTIVNQTATCSTLDIFQGRVTETPADKTGNDMSYGHKKKKKKDKKKGEKDPEAAANDETPAAPPPPTDDDAVEFDWAPETVNDNPPEEEMIE